VSDYIVLSTSDASFVKRYWAENFSERWERSRTMEYLTSGRVSIGMGGKRRLYRYGLFVPQATDDGDYGTLDDLEDFFDLSDPNGTPTNTITLSKHDGEDVEVKIVNDFEVDPYAVLLSGNNAYYSVELELVEVNEAGEGYYLLDYSDAVMSFYWGGV
jgi:hypothetical protein